MRDDNAPTAAQGRRIQRDTAYNSREDHTGRPPKREGTK